jgi:hypothetical protein
MSILDIAVALGCGALLILAALAVFNILSHSKQPALHAVLDALTPYIYKAIFAGERFALLAEQQLDTRLAGTDKKAVADSMYNLLPDFLPVGRFLLPINVVKMLVPRVQFEQVVQDVYEQTHGFLLKNEDYLKQQVNGLKLPEIP